MRFAALLALLAAIGVARPCIAAPASQSADTSAEVTAPAAADSGNTTPAVVVAPPPRRAPEAARAADPHAVPQPAPPPRTAPTDLRRVSDWIAFLNARHLASLPVESRIFFRRGLIARQAGQNDEALEEVRGAAELDPSFVEPHLTLAAWMLTREPSQALQQYAVVVELLRQNFNFQLGLAANAALIAFEALFIGLLLSCLILVWLRRDELTHAWRERLAAFATPGGARWWALAVFLLPFLAGFGITLPTLGFFGYLWPNLRVRERVAGVLLLVTVLATPLALAVVERFSLPLHGEAAPFYDVPRLETIAYSPALEQRLATLAKAQPDNGIVHFGLAWVARRGGHLALAETAYRRVVQLWPHDDRALTNLGNVLAMEGRPDDAIAAYEAAIAVNPANAAAHFNASQMHTQRYEYQAASEALSRASALNFELVRTYQSQATTDGLLPLIDQWLEPRVFWVTMRTAPIPHDMAGAVPIALRGHIETSGWRFSLLALVVFALCLAAGSWQHGRLHLRRCGNCGDIVCRRCAVRRRELALCPACSELEGPAQTPDAGRGKLLQYRVTRQRRARQVELAFAALIPGYGLLALRRVFTPVFLMGSSWLLIMGWLGAAPPLALEPRLALPGDEVPPFMLLILLVLVYATSLLGYLQQSARAVARDAELHESTRGRVTQATRRVMHTAA